MDFDGVRSSLSCDATGRLVQGTNGIALQTSGYNALGQRVSRQVVGGPNSGVRLYAYDEEGRPLGVYVPDSSEPDGFRVLEEYVHLDGWRPVAVVRPDLTHGMNVPRIHPILTDHLGTPRKVLDGDSGEVRWDWDAKDPFGHQAPNETPTSGFVPFSFELRFPGQRHDPALGLYHNGFRDYHPGLGRYVQSDPLGLEAGWNTYGYAEYGPLFKTDPLGLACNERGCWLTEEERLYAEMGDWELYYRTACSGGDVYSCRAFEVAAQEARTFMGYFGVQMTNARLERSLVKNNPEYGQCNHKLEGAMESIRLGLMREHVIQVEQGTPNKPHAMTGKDVSDFHRRVFEENNAGSAFGGDLPGSNYLFKWCKMPSCRK